MKVIDNVVKNAILLKPRENVLIVYDKPKEKIAKSFAKSCEKYGAKVSLVRIKQGKETKREPPEEVVDMMKKSDVVLGITTISLTHTHAVRSALKSGARIATMPDITEGMFPALGINYKRMLSLCKKLKRKFEKAKCAHITTKRGTDISVHFKGRKVSMDDGLLDKSGSLHNLPAGEVGVAPLEDSANGKIVVDICMAGLDKLRSSLTIHVKKGRITRITGKKDAIELKRIFRRADKNSKTIAEFAIGTNKKAKPMGKVLNDEKVYGTCHFAFGDNISLGGKNRSNVHLDGVIQKPTIWFDNRMIMKDGNLL